MNVRGLLPGALRFLIAIRSSCEAARVAEAVLTVGRGRAVFQARASWAPRGSTVKIMNRIVGAGRGIGKFGTR